MMIPYAILVLLAVMGQTIGLGLNIARGGKAAQSSDFNGAFSARAIDGDRSGKYRGHSCTHTNRDLNPWWRVDLLKTYKVSHVTIIFRSDSHQTGINGAEIHIGNSLNNNGNANPRCAVIPSFPRGGSKTYQCNGMKGRYVNIVIPGRKENLSLCEVEVFGTLSDDDFCD